MLKKGILVITLLLTLMIMVACQSPVEEKTDSTLTISAAASLKEAMTEIKELYISENPDTELILTFASSGSLAEQIKQGAQVDVFLSASTKYMDDLKEAGEVDQTSLKNLLANEVVLIVPKNSTTTITDFSQLIDPSIKKIGIGEPQTVPAGQYASEVFAFYNIKDQIKDKIVYAKDVKEVLTWVETENVTAGVVYSTDAKVSDSVKIIATASSDSHKAIIYPIAVTKASKNPQTAKAFIDFLSSNEIKEIFVKYGFETL